MSGDQDLLERATRALRETASPSDQELADGKAVLLWAQRTELRKKRSRKLRWIVPLAAMLTAGSALAATEPGQRLARAVVALIVPSAHEGERTPRPKVVRAPRSKLPSTQPAPSEPVQPQPVVPSTEPVDATAPGKVADASARAIVPGAIVDASAHEAPSPTRRARSPRPEARDKLAPPPEPPQAVVPAAPPQAEAPAPSEPPSDADLAAYRAAHRAHFGQRDFKRALAFWNDYLVAFPQGTFAIEARYNRAICLVRLGFTEEAQSALLPFARGEVGRGYRQAEATKLLEALE